jgi:hypothetical protein
MKKIETNPLLDIALRPRRLQLSDFNSMMHDAQLDGVLREAKESLERLSGAEREAQDMRVQRDALEREVAGLNRELHARKQLEREHNAKYSESLHAAVLVAGVRLFVPMRPRRSAMDVCGRRAEEIPRRPRRGTQPASRDRGDRARSDGGSEARPRP